MDQITKKIMTMHKALHPWDDVDQLYVSRKGGGGGGGELTSIEDSVNASIQQLGDYVEKRRERLITATRNNSDNTMTDRTEITRKQKWEEKQPFESFKWVTRDISHEKIVDVAMKGKH